MITLKDVQATLKVDGFVNSTALSFNELRLKLAKKLRIATDDAIFDAHKEAIKDSYIKIFDEVCAASKKVDVRPAPLTKPSTRKSNKRHVSESEGSESDCSSVASGSEERVTRSRKRSASSSVLPKCGRVTNVAEAVPQESEKPTKDFHRLTIAELKSMLNAAGVECGKLKRKSEYVAAAESVALKEKVVNGEVASVITVPSDDDQLSTQPASTVSRPFIVVVSSSDDDDDILDVTVSCNGAQSSQASRITQAFSHQLAALNSDSPAFPIPKASIIKTARLVRAGSQALQNTGFAAYSGAGPYFPAVSQQSNSSFGVGQPAFASALVTPGRVLGGSAASSSNRVHLSEPVYKQPSAIVSGRGELMFDPVLDANGAEIEMNEYYRESNDVLYGRLHIKTVGIQHYRGVIHLQEAVFLIREPRNPYDSNAIRVDNLSRVQIGHVAAKDGKQSNNKPRFIIIFTPACSFQALQEPWLRLWTVPLLTNHVLKRL
jgi:hypothetical protein